MILKPYTTNEESQICFYSKSFLSVSMMQANYYAVNSHLTIVCPPTSEQPKV